MSQVGYLMIPPEAWNAPPYLLWRIWPHYTQLSRVREFQFKYDQRKQDNTLLAMRGVGGGGDQETIAITMNLYLFVIGIQ